jgi:hypothetical protein
MKESNIETKGLSRVQKAELRKAKRREKKKLKKKKKNALVICRDGKEFWTTQDQFWQWTREKVVAVTGHNPLRGDLLKTDEEYSVVLANTVLNLRCPNHLREAMESRRYRTG